MNYKDVCIILCEGCRNNLPSLRVCDEKKWYHTLNGEQVECTANLWRNNAIEVEESFKKRLISLDYHNELQRIKYYKEKGSEPILNGIACPKCGEELYDSNPYLTLTSAPPQKNIHCSKCDFVGYRISN